MADALIDKLEASVAELLLALGSASAPAVAMEDLGVAAVATLTFGNSSLLMFKDFREEEVRVRIRTGEEFYLPYVDEAMGWAPRGRGIAAMLDAPKAWTPYVFDIAAIAARIDLLKAALAPDKIWSTLDAIERDRVARDEELAARWRAIAKRREEERMGPLAAWIDRHLRRIVGPRG